MTVLPREPQPDERVVSTAVTRALAFDLEVRDRVLDICFRDLEREREARGDVIVTVVPEGFGPRVVDHVNKAATEAIANAR
jgi:hypothetical protein